MLRSNLILCFVVCGLIIQSGCKPKSAFQDSPPPKVTAVKPVVETVPIFLEENGETEAVEQAVVEARVQGILGELIPDPNDAGGVTKGDPLFEINPEEYEAALASAAADLSSAQAALESAKAEVEVAAAKTTNVDAKIKVAEAEVGRLGPLLDSKAVSKSEYDISVAERDTALADREGSVAAEKAAVAQIANAEALIKKANAELKEAELNMSWTKVEAPIDGRITKTLVKAGNMVEKGTPLIEIVKNDPIWANFNINERFLLNLERQSNRDSNRRDLSTIKVELQRSGDIGFPFEGHLDYSDPRVDQNTGTLQLRAVFDNPPGKSGLLPGLFVRVRVQVGQYENALLIPERAIGRDQVGAFVYVVGSDQKAVRKNVVLGTKHNEMIVIESGLEPNDSVIVDGLQRVRPGIEVDPGKNE